MMTHARSITSPLSSDTTLHPILRATVQRHGGRVVYRGMDAFIAECAVYPPLVPLVWDDAHRWWVLAAPAEQGTTPQ